MDRLDAKKRTLDRAAKREKLAAHSKKAAPPTEAKDLFRWLFGPLDPQTMEPLPYNAAGDLSATLAQTMEFFRVKPEKLGDYIPFKMRPVQRHLHELKLAAWRRNRVFKGIVLKTRRYGMTTYEIVESMALMLRVAGWIGSTIASDDSDAMKFGRLIEECIDQIPEWVLEMLGLEIVTRKSKEIAVRHTKKGSGFMRSVFMIFSANSATGIGRGSTNNKLHPTEPPHYRSKAKADYSSIQPSLGDFAGNCEVWESTAAGYDSMFHPQWEDAHWPDEPKRESEFVRVFVPAYAHPNFYRKFESDKEMDELEAAIGVDVRFGGPTERFYYESLLLPYQRGGDLPHDCIGTDPEDRSEKAVRRRALEQINYMRMLVVDKCKPEGHSRRCQEYPMTPEEAFQSTGSPFFDLAKVRAWMPHAKLEHRTAVRGRFVSDGKDVTWKPDVNGLWLMREDRQEGFIYAFGADTASGVRRHASGKTEGDYSTCVIGEIMGGSAVCVLRAHLKPREHAPEIAKAAKYYSAKGYVERAVAGDAGSVLTHMEQFQIGDWWAIDCVLMGTKMVWSDHHGQRVEEKIVGFQTRLGTKTPLCEQLSAFLDEEVPDFREGLRCPIDYETLREMNYFERRQKVSSSGQSRVSLQASQGHDDMVMTWALFIQARRVMLENTLLQTPVRLENDPELAIWQARWETMEALQSGEDYYL